MLKQYQFGKNKIIKQVVIGNDFELEEYTRLTCASNSLEDTGFDNTDQDQSEWKEEEVCIKETSLIFVSKLGGGGHS